MWWPSTALGVMFFYMSYKRMYGLREFFLVMGCINLALGYWLGNL
jgi:hypothetical protein